MARYYVDTCVWIDFLEERTTSYFLVKCFENNDIVIYSPEVERELVKLSYIDDIRISIKLLESRGLMEYISVTESQRYRAFLISSDRRVPLADALHAILARDSNAILVTRDKHFKELTDICRIKLL